MKPFTYELKKQRVAVAPPRVFSRKETDMLFRQIMKQEKVSAWRRFFAYWGVRLFGKGVWKARP